MFFLQWTINVWQLFFFSFFFRFINTRSENMNITVGSVNFFAPSSYGISEILSVERGKWVLYPTIAILNYNHVVTSSNSLSLLELKIFFLWTFYGLSYHTWLQIFMPVQGLGWWSSCVFLNPADTHKLPANQTQRHIILIWGFLTLVPPTHSFLAG